MKIMEEVCDTLTKAETGVYSFQAKAPGQIEISLNTSAPVEAIDKVMVAQEALRAIVDRYGLKASMAPRPIPEGAKNGLHPHFSLNPMPKYAAADAFIAGILDNMKTLMAFGMPYVDSYTSSQDNTVGYYIGWSIENRDLPIRKISENRWECRIIDGTANMYLFIAALLTAGLNGMKEQTELRWKDCMLWECDMTSKMLELYGITERLPTELETTLDAARQNDMLSAS